MKNLEKTLQLLPLAYLFLIALGILKESLFYFQVGINIMNYASIVDVIMSPIAELTSSTSVLFGCIIYTFFPFLFVNVLKKYSHKKWTYYFTNEKDMSQYSEEVKEEKYLMLTIGILAAGYIGYFVGFGVINGHKIADKLAKNEIQYEDSLKLNNDEIIKCHILGSNSQYYFYVKPNEIIEIAPIGSISTIINQPEIKSIK